VLLQVIDNLIVVARSALSGNHGLHCFNWWKLHGKLPWKSLQLVNLLFHFLAI